MPPVGRVAADSCFSHSFARGCQSNVCAGRKPSINRSNPVLLVEFHLIGCVGFRRTDDWVNE